MTSGKSDAALLTEQSGTVSTSYSCVVIRAWGHESLEVQAPASNTLLEVSQDDEASGDVWVQAADQWGPFLVTTRVWSAEPPEPAADWEDIVEVNVQTTGALIATEMIDNEPQLELNTEPGTYRLRVSARGRVIRDGIDEPDGDLGEDGPPKESFLLEMWPTAGDSGARFEPRILRLTSPYAQNELNPPPAPVVPSGEAGLAAAGRIGRDVDGKPGARPLSGAAAMVRVERTVRGTRRRLFRVVAHLTTFSHWWVEGSSWSWGGHPGDEFAYGLPEWANSHTHPDQFTGEYGGVRYSFVEVVKPHRAVRTWEWMTPSEPGKRMVEDLVPFLPSPTTFTATLVQSRNADGQEWTTITLEHDGVPVEWVEDLTTYWNYQLEIIDIAEFGVKK